MKEQIQRIKDELREALSSFDNLDLRELKLVEVEANLRKLRDLKIRFTGKKSPISEAKRQIGALPAEQRASFGKLIQETESEILNSIEHLERELASYALDLKTRVESLDVTIPGFRPESGSLHPITLLRQRIEDIFVSMGYAVEDDREIENDYYNFDALNIPEGHPAREAEDTFYTTNGLALRSQTSTVQIRAMERRGVPIRIIAPGKVYRNDTPDPTHIPMFHQVEGLCVDRGITMAHLKGTVAEWLRRLFGKGTKIRMRPSYFPFTEPSAEFDFSCFKCSGTGVFEGEKCRPCKGTGWIELGGCGMVHPNVLRNCGVDPQVFSGFAFGFGLERMCAMLYSIDDIRLMYENDVRFLKQFR
ncbi:MAG: phenylalanine--tRNA ligase subunit alpha [Pyrinomonadaceae bacterium]|nr:phenylalanine--tRNA ligase subunit alpha [Pyrinomonadaceae bacterium]MCX7638939.1 phenylalanine--tRNA ligase subunit alpha [Pyrinomonadaceae bacterium]MDW8304924.1 phenylalanine--tRNA ligase subunit alpha [Acidobacteriota bacterium]